LQICLLETVTVFGKKKKKKRMLPVCFSRVADPECFIPDPGGKKAPVPDLHWF
jgi:hypothetical protein